MYSSLKAFFHFAILTQCLFFIFYLIPIHTQNSISKKLLIAFLILKAVPELGDFIYYFVDLRIYLADKTPYFFYAQEAFDFAWAPVLYFFIISRNTLDFRFQAKHLLHAVPFVVMLITATWKVIGITQTDIVQTICYNFLWENDEYFLFTSLQYVQFFVYFLLSWKAVRQSEEGLKNFTAEQTHEGIQWLKLLLLGLFSWRLIMAINFILWFLFDFSIHFLIVTHLLAEITFLFFLMLFFLKGVHQSHVFLEYLQFKSKYATMPMTLSSKTKIIDDLLVYMRTAKPYLRAELRIQEVADAIQVPPHQLSQAINEKLRKNFQDFVNAYRVEESKYLLSNFTSTEKNISQIIYEAGFNTKSVFNAAFKKNTGTTPSAYRETYRMETQKADLN